jgi:glycosyltransferase involved in cell wall biosynthesis
MRTSASIIICTYNRASSLVETLETITQMDVPEGVEWEVLVVDNNSTDDTREAVARFIQAGHKDIRYLFEAKQGKAYALNHAIHNAHGEILAFTDDDALVGRQWLQLILDTFSELKPDCVGGKVVPVWLDQRPDWLTDRLLNVLAMLDLGESVHALDGKKGEMLYGVNFAFKKDFFVKHGLFNTELCSRGAGNEDHELFQRLQRSGGRAIYHPGIVVRHKVFPERMRKPYFRRWHYLVGRDRAKLVTNTSFRVFGIEGYMIRHFLALLGKYVRALFALDREQIFYYELKVILYLSFFETRMKQFAGRGLPLAGGNP